MASIEISSMREQFPGKSDKVAAAEYAKKWNVLMIIQYKLEPDGEYTNIGLCEGAAEADNYFQSPACHSAKTLYDGRWEKADQLTTFSEEALMRNIVFGEFGCASKPCCWNCRHFSISMGDEKFCRNHRTQVDRRDYCNNWFQRSS